MTIEIRQLIIRAVVESPPGAAGRGAVTIDPPVAEVRMENKAAPALASDRSALVAACVREVLRELKKARGR